MAYSIVGIVNLALGRIGAGIISSLSENSPNAIKANAVWEYIRDEVLQAKDWRFAKIRYTMAVSATSPLYGYKYAYPLPSDFLRLVRPKSTSLHGMVNPVAYPPGYWYYIIDPTGYSRYFDYDPPVFPAGIPYVIETLPADGSLVLMTDYDNSAFDLFINYIRKVTDPTKYTPAFINALAFRLAAELAIAITENMQKSKGMLEMYQATLESAAAQTESLDSLTFETGSTEWEDAGR